MCPLKLMLQSRWGLDVSKRRAAMMCFTGRRSCNAHSVSNAHSTAEQKHSCRGHQRAETLQWIAVMTSGLFYYRATPITLTHVAHHAACMVVQDSNFKEVGKQVLQDFHDWVQVRCGCVGRWGRLSTHEHTVTGAHRHHPSCQQCVPL